MERIDVLIAGAGPAGCAARNERTAKAFREAGFDVLVSIGELEENLIGSNCGMVAGEYFAA